MRLPNTFLMANPQTQTSSPRRCNQLGLMNGIFAKRHMAFHSIHERLRTLDQILKGFGREVVEIQSNIGAMGINKQNFWMGFS